MLCLRIYLYINKLINLLLYEIKCNFYIFEFNFFSLFLFIYIFYI